MKFTMQTNADGGTYLVSSFIVETDCESVTACNANGSEIEKGSALYDDLADCTGSGDAEGACRYVLDRYRPEFRTVAKNRLATDEEIATTCRAIYFESETDFDADPELARVYLIWQVASSVTEG